MAETKLRKFIVSVQNGRFTVDDSYKQHLWKKYLEQFEGMKVWMTLDAKIPSRTVRQNNYYWLYLGLISDSTGHTADEIHSWAKGKFLTSNINEVFGDKVRVTKSTTKLNKDEFSDYIQNIESHTGIPTPDPTPFQIPLFEDEWKTLKDAQSKIYSKSHERN